MNHRCVRSRPCNLRYCVVTTGRHNRSRASKYRINPSTTASSARTSSGCNHAGCNIEATIRQSGERNALIEFCRDVELFQRCAQPFQPVRGYAIAGMSDVIRNRNRRSKRKLPESQSHSATRYISPDPRVIDAGRRTIYRGCLRQRRLRIN